MADEHESIQPRRTGTAARLERKIDQLHDDFRELRNLVQETHAGRVATDARLAAVSSDVARLNLIVRDGNGHPSLISQIASCRSDMDARYREFDEFKKQSMDEDKEQNSYVRNLRLAVIGGVITLAVSAVTAAVTWALSPGNSRLESPAAHGRP